MAMREIPELILPQVPVEGISVHIGRSRLSMGDPVTARLVPDGRVAIWARVYRPLLGIIPRWRSTCLGHLGPVAAQIVTPALLEGHSLRLRVVMLTPEHLAVGRDPEIHVSVWGDPKLLLPFLEMTAPPPLMAEEARPRPPRKTARA
jgi:hypothetical protein